MTQDERAAMQQDALDRAQNGQSLTNYPAIYKGFMAKGIARSEFERGYKAKLYHYSVVVPRENEPFRVARHNPTEQGKG